MKKFTSVLSTGVLALSMLLAGCSSNSGTADTKDESTPTPETTTVPSEETAETETAAPLLGGWTANTSYSTLVGDHENEIFTEAAEKAYATDLKPVQVLATQVVNGTNYAFLTYSEDAGTFGIAVVYESLDGEISLTSSAEIDVAAVAGKDNIDENLLGGYTVTGSGKPGATSAEAENALTNALQSYVGISNLMPIALLGTQVVSGTNYRMLCYGAPTTADPQTAVYVVTVYEDLDGKAEISEIQVFDLLSYIGE